MNDQNQLIERPSWWKRNWKWVVPVGGCLTTIIVGVILLVGGVFAFANEIKSATGGDQLLEEARANAQLIEVLGEPIENDGLGSFNISTSNNVKTIRASVPLKGPKGQGTITRITREEDGKLVYEEYKITIDDTNQVIDLSGDVLPEGDH